MNPNDRVFRAVAAEADSRRGYDYALHGRVHDLVLDWLDMAEGSNLPYAASPAAWNSEVRDCTDWVKGKYRQEYGMPILALLWWPFISSIISFIVQRTLEKLFPRPEQLGQTGATGSPDL